MSIKLSAEIKKGRIVKICETCGQRFSIVLSKKDIARYCSKYCYTEWQKGRSAWNKGMPSEKKGRSYEEIYGKEGAIIERQKRSDAQKGRIMPMGENAFNWRGGVSSENNKVRSSKKYRDFIREAMERDNFTCQRCNKRGGDLEVHHWKLFKSYPKLRFDFNNVSTLCEDCHKIVDKYRH